MAEKKRYTKLAYRQSTSTADIDQDIPTPTQVQMADILEEEIKLTEDGGLPKTPSSPDGRNFYRQPKSVRNLSSTEHNINAIVQQDLVGNPKSWDWLDVAIWFNFNKLHKFKEIFEHDGDGIEGKELLLITEQKLFEEKYQENVTKLKITRDDPMTVKFFR